MSVNENGSPITLKHSKIFDYWKDKYITKDGDVFTEQEAPLKNCIPVVVDWGEPECWCCGKLFCVEENPRYKSLLDDYNFKEIWDLKEVTKRVDRCHIRPRSLGGSEDASNAFLMCKKCHAASPDTIYPRGFFKYVYKSRKKNLGNPLCKSFHLASECKKRIQEYENINDVLLGIIFNIAIANTNPGQHYASHLYEFLTESVVTATVEKTLDIYRLLKQGDDKAVEDTYKFFMETTNNEYASIISKDSFRAYIALLCANQPLIKLTEHIEQYAQ